MPRARPVPYAVAAAGAAGAGAADGQIRIRDIQGDTRISPLAGEQVTGVPGVVTAVRAFGSACGFWLQDPRPDTDPATGEGLFVFTGSPEVTPGDEVEVSGSVAEYYPGGKDAGLQSVTELRRWRGAEGRFWRDRAASTGLVTP
ncbi:hypothetical protein AA958_05530 [Streptomyces sp. CNQ-509]|nr:hypothetical protein AA958_05530 [Streptomyces sp. CNQ-509]